MRKLALAIAVAMASGRAGALGLGDIELHSALNEPLNAEVRLLAAQPGELNNASASLAPNDEFERAGIERSSALSDINFAITRRDDGTAVVKITSTQPIREPFLDFIVQMQSQSGRLLREYTVLLDPPVFGEEKAAPISAPIAASLPAPAAAPAPAVTAPVPAPAPAVPAAPAPPAAAPVPANPVKAPAPRQSQQHAAAAKAAPGMAGAKSYGPTRRNETLWSIAASVRSDDSVSVYQMMMALLKENPEAFYNHNVNNLMAGYVLRVPDKSAALAIDETAAVKEAARQYESWQQSRRGSAKAPGGEPAPAAGAAETASQAGGAAQEQDKDKARLRLVAPGDMSAKSAAAGGVQAEITRLRSELAMALESSDTAKREGDELRSRVAALEGQIYSLQRLLTLKNESLGDLQKRSGMAAVPPPNAPPAAAKPPALTIPSAGSAKPAPVKPVPVKPAAPKSGESQDLLANPTLVAAAGGAALLLLSVLWLVLRRRRGADDADPGAAYGADEATMVPQADVQPIRTEMQESAAVPMSEQEEYVGPAVVINPDQTQQQMTRVAEEVAHGAEQDIPKAASDLDVLHTAEGEIDPIVEADVYLAYRRYQQAESLVQSALAKQPGRQDLQAKLLEIYYAAKNPGSFQALAQTLYENLGKNADDPLWQRIMPMGRELCPDHALFGAAQGRDAGAAKGALGANPPAAGSAAAAPDEKMEFDLNLGDGALGEPAAGKGTAGPALEDQPQHNAWEIESAASDFGNVDFGLDDTDLLAGTDVVGTKLDLARAYIDMGDTESARDILTEVIKEGNDQQKHEAKVLVEKIA